MSRGFGNILHEQTPTERDGDGSQNETLWVIHYDPLIGINEADIHHKCVTAHKSDSRGRLVPEGSGSN